MPSTLTFAAAGSVTFAVPAIAASLAMPAVDGGNLDVAITNAGSAPVWLSFAAGAPVGSTVPGCVAIPGASQVLLTTNVSTLMAGNRLVLTGPQALAAQTATVVSAVTGPLPTPVTITRGTATAKPVWRT